MIGLCEAGIELQALCMLNQVTAGSFLLSLFYLSLKWELLVVLVAIRCHCEDMHKGLSSCVAMGSV